MEMLYNNEKTKPVEEKKKMLPFYAGAKRRM